MLLVVVAVVALMPAAAFALKAPPTGAPCQIAPKGEWTFCPFGGLARRNLSGAELQFANLYKANLTDANLTGAKLTDANLIGANLTNAKLTGANLYGADRVCPDFG